MNVLYKSSALVRCMEVVYMVQIGGTYSTHSDLCTVDQLQYKSANCTAKPKTFS